MSACFAGRKEKMSDFLQKANSAPMYLICGAVVVCVLLQSVLFLVRAWRHGVKIGMRNEQLKGALTSSILFSLIPSIGILIGVIALAPSLGIPVPWMRLSVIGALHYEGSTANNLAKGMGLGELPSSAMTGGSLAAIVFGMTVNMLWSALFILFFFKRYQKRVKSGASKDPKLSNILFAAMFTGMICAYFGDTISYLRTVETGGAVRTPNVLPLTAFVTAFAAMAVFQKIMDSGRAKWLKDYAQSFSMLIGMTCAVLGQFLFPTLSAFPE